MHKLYDTQCMSWPMGNKRSGTLASVAVQRLVTRDHPPNVLEWRNGILELLCIVWGDQSKDLRIPPFPTHLEPLRPQCLGRGSGSACHCRPLGPF